MSEQGMLIVLWLLVGIIGAALVITYGSWQLLFGILLLLWGNNIANIK